MTRTYGLSGSGMDVDQMVKDIMKARRVQYDTLAKKKTQLEWKKTDYNTMYSSISEFRNTVFNNKLQSNLSPRKTSTTNSAAVTATSSAESSNMTHSIEVTKLANGVQEASSAKITTGSSKDTLVNQFGMTAGNFNLQITNGTSTATVSVDTTQSINDVVNNINKAGIGIVASYDTNSDRFFLSTSGSGASTGIDFAGSSALGLDFISNNLKLISPPTVSGTATSSKLVDVSLTSLSPTFTGGNLKMTNGLNSTTLAITTGDSVDSLINKINSATGLNAVASIDALGKFSIKSTSGILDLSGSDASVLTVLTSGLNLPNTSNELSTIGTVGVTSSTALATADPTKTLASIFSNIAGKGTMHITDGTTTKDLEIDFSKATMTTIKDSINALGLNVEASYDTLTRTFSISGTSGATVNLTGSDPIVNNFLTNNLKMTNSTDAGGFTSSTSSEALFSDPLNTSIATQFGLLAGGTYNFRLTNGTSVNTISLNTTTDTMQTFMDKISNAGVSATTLYNYTTRQFTISATSGTLDFTGSDTTAMAFLGSKLKLTNVNAIDTTGSKSSAGIFTSEAEKNVTSQFSGITGGKFDLLINGTTIAVDTDTQDLDDLVANINTAIPGTASYAAGKFTLNGTLNFTGSDPAAIEFLTNKLQFNSNAAKKGNDAEIKLDGIIMEQTSNVFTVSGVTYTLNGLTNSGGLGNPASVIITSDIDKTVENVKKFVESYNAMLKKLNDELAESKYKDYLPLTEEEKTAMSDDQIKTWEEKAKSGMLRRDPILSDLVNKMRNNFNDAVIGISGSKTSATAIGIDTGIGTYQEGGTLYINEAKLKNALNEDPDAVYKIFGTDGSLLTGNQKGIAGRMYDSLKGAMDKISREGGITASTDYDTKSNIGKSVKDYKTRMTDMTRRLNDMESRYYKQFDAMEQALAKMQKQSSWLAGSV